METKCLIELKSNTMPYDTIGFIVWLKVVGYFSFKYFLHININIYINI